MLLVSLRGLLEFRPKRDRTGQEAGESFTGTTEDILALTMHPRVPFCTFTRMHTYNANRQPRQPCFPAEAPLPVKSRHSMLLLIPPFESAIHSNEREGERERERKRERIGGGGGSAKCRSWLRELRWWEHLRAELNKGHSLRRERKGRRKGCTLPELADLPF